ncbi:MBL fold metallo-hydrolase [Rubellimicrobium roseum]|uniref:MBL fold metallo-hydrolase n=1 Tax=Rubellimicrobium roseum TaxID=687525 RepID=A0A5C4N810_9RHOB|nr:MBL fold metallo-hydrolase [Rubellimicrobium roseum]TNC69817.1 MBL fold metallo-hydrolase [Rubellimicrobium roseum]
MGPISFVGTRGLGICLIETGDGLILMNTGMPGSGPMIEEPIRALGHDPAEIEILLAGHAHVDHVGGHA